MSTKPWTVDDISKLKMMFNGRIKNSDISIALGRSYSNVCKKCRELGLKSRMAIMMGEQKIARERGMIICRGCSTEKTTDNFPMRERGGRYTRCLCRECEAKFSLERYRNKKSYSLEETLHRRAYQAKRRSIKKKMEFRVTVADLLEIYNGQNGKCYYSGITMERIPKVDNYYNVSIDRVDSSIGYIKSNIVLCCDSINTMKNAMPKDVFIDICKKIVLHQKLQVESVQ